MKDRQPHGVDGQTPQTNGEVPLPVKKIDQWKKFKYQVRRAITYSILPLLIAAATSSEPSPPESVPAPQPQHEPMGVLPEILPEVQVGGPNSDAYRTPQEQRRLATDHGPYPSGEGTTPDMFNPSAYMTGRSVVRVVRVESAGGTENWTPEEIATANQEVEEAVSSWERIGNGSVQIDVVHQVVTVSKEPIALPRSDKSWVLEALAKLGCTDPDMFIAAYKCNQELREQLGTDWSTTIFLVDGSNDADGKFADLKLSYSYVNGPFATVISSRAAGRLAAVIAHELGHIYGALDEYKEADVLCQTLSGYVGAPTTNSASGKGICLSHVESIMESLVAFEGDHISPSARRQVGLAKNPFPTGFPTETGGYASSNVAITAGFDTISVNGSVCTNAPKPKEGQQPLNINEITGIYLIDSNGNIVKIPPKDGGYGKEFCEEVASVIAKILGVHAAQLIITGSAGGRAFVVGQEFAQDTRRAKQYFPTIRNNPSPPRSYPVPVSN